MGRTDIEDAFKRLEKLIWEEFQMAMAQTLKETVVHKHGAHAIQPGHHLALNHCPHRCQESQRGYCEQIRPCCGEHRRNKVFVISGYYFRLVIRTDSLNPGYREPDRARRSKLVLSARPLNELQHRVRRLQ